MSARLRVAFVQAWLPVGGAERIVETLVRRMDPERVESHLVHLYAPGEIGERLARDGHPTVARLAHGSLDPFAGARLAAALRRWAIDVVHVFDSALPMAWCGALRRRSRRPGVVLGFHSTARVGGRLAYAVADAVTLPVVDRFVALGGAHRDLLARRFRIAPDRFAVIPSGVDLDRFHPAPDRGAAKRALGLATDAFVVGLVAALRPEKDLACFVDVARRVCARQPDARFVVAGSGPEAGALGERIAAARLERHVALLGSREDVPAVWAAVDVALLTSRTEALPVSLLEAHACGVPAVSTDVGSVRDIVVHGETGYLAPSADAAALAAHVLALAAEPARRAGMAAAARARAEARFGLAHMVERYAQVFAGAAEAR